MHARRYTLYVVLAFSVVTTARGAVIDIVDDMQGAFIDISATGTPLDLGPEEETIIFTIIGNDVFGAGNVVVGNNGGLGFDVADTELAALNEPIPSNNAYGGNQALLAFWDDIGNTVGDVYVQELADRLIVQWHDRRFEGSKDTSRFQVQIFQGTGPTTPEVVAQMIYDDIEQPRAGFGASATIGYQDGAAGFNDVQWSFNTAGAVANGTVLTVLLIPEPGALAILTCGTCLLLRRAGKRTHPH